MMKGKKGVVALAIAASLMASSCLGPNKWFNGLTDWNHEVTDQDWLNEVIFLGLNIIPVYGVALLVDYVVLNTIDYWSGGAGFKDAE